MALALASNGHTAQALQHTEVVAHAAGATYLDEVFAYVAAAGAYLQDGNHPRAELSAEAAVARAMAVGDVVATALATTMFHVVTGRRHAAHDEPTQLGDGWERVVRQLTPGAN
jgi:hypothetical protein